MGCWWEGTFYMSSRPAVESSNMSSGISTWIAQLLRPDYQNMSPADWTAYLDVVHVVVRKIAHFSEYSILGIWICTDFFLWKKKDVPETSSLRRILLCSWLVGTAYAVSDEFHQIFVEGRSGELLDVLIDSGGVLTGVMLICLVRFWGGKNKK